MSRPVGILDRGTTFVVTGYQAADLCRAAGLKPLYNGRAGGFVMDAHRLPDLLAHAQRENRPVRITPDRTSEVTQ